MEATLILKNRNPNVSMEYTLLLIRRAGGQEPEKVNGCKCFPASGCAESRSDVCWKAVRRGCRGRVPMRLFQLEDFELVPLGTEGYPREKGNAPLVGPDDRPFPVGYATARAVS